MRHASLFSGIGGPEIAAAMMGWDNVFHCEINPFGRQILNYWFPNSGSYEDITKTDFKHYRGTIDVLTGGFPCQPFSCAGKRKGQTDDRYLWPEMLRVIDEIRPTWVIGENVAGITTMVESGKTTYVGSETPILEENHGVHRFRSEHTFTIERICQDLEKIGYSVQPMLIPACAVGAPHRRDRVFILAYNTDHRDGLRKPGEKEGTDEEERLSNRGAVRMPGESDNVRSEVQEHAPDSAMQGHDRRCSQINRWKKTGQIEFQSDTSRLSCQLDAPNSDSRGRDEILEYLQSEVPNGEEPFCDSRIRIVARMSPEERWQRFPTISPVHRGNDGLPFDVDDLAIPFAKWRNESIKAYGNAIVPQVMYRIFQCIEQLNV